MKSGYAFSRGRAQFFASHAHDLAKASEFYGFGRSLPLPLRLGVTAVLFVPGLRRGLIAPHSFAPPCGEDTLANLLLQLNVPGRRSLVFYQRRGQFDHFAALIYSSSRAFGFVQVRPEQERFPYPEVQMLAFRFPRAKGEVSLDGWHARLLELLPGFHRPYAWNSDVVPEVASQASRVLASVLPRPHGTPDHWRPIHGDLTPWNLRVDRRGRVWLIDWERSRFGPPLADIFRHAITDATLTLREPETIATLVAERLGGMGEDLREAARFWLSDPIFADVEDLREGIGQQSWPDSDWDRGVVEYEAIRLLAEEG